MIKLQPVSDLQEVKQLFDNPVMFKASLMDRDIAEYEAGTWEPSPYFTYLKVLKGSKCCGLIRMYEYTPVTYDVHYHLYPEVWGSGVSDAAQKELEKYLIENTGCVKMLIQTPRCCKEVIKAADRGGYNVEAILPYTTFWRGKIEDIVIMTKFIRGGSSWECY